jgi:hypothetical protein
MFLSPGDDEGDGEILHEPIIIASRSIRQIADAHVIKKIDDFRAIFASEILEPLCMNQEACRIAYLAEASNLSHATYSSNITRRISVDQKTCIVEHQLPSWPEYREYIHAYGLPGKDSSFAISGCVDNNDLNEEYEGDITIIQEENPDSSEDHSPSVSQQLAISSRLVHRLTRQETLTPDQWQSLTSQSLTGSGTLTTTQKKSQNQVDAQCSLGLNLARASLRTAYSAADICNTGEGVDQSYLPKAELQCRAQNSPNDRTGMIRTRRPRKADVPRSAANGQGEEYQISRRCDMFSSYPAISFYKEKGECEEEGKVTGLASLGKEGNDLPCNWQKIDLNPGIVKHRAETRCTFASSNVELSGEGEQHDLEGIAESDSVIDTLLSEVLEFATRAKSNPLLPDHSNGGPEPQELPQIARNDADTASRREATVPEQYLHAQVSSVKRDSVSDVLNSDLSGDVGPGHTNTRQRTSTYADPIARSADTASLLITTRGLTLQEGEDIFSVEDFIDKVLAREFAKPLSPLACLKGLNLEERYNARSPTVKRFTGFLVSLPTLLRLVTFTSLSLRTAGFAYAIFEPYILNLDTSSRCQLLGRLLAIDMKFAQYLCLVITAERDRHSRDLPAPATATSSVNQAPDSMQESLLTRFNFPPGLANFARHYNFQVSTIFFLKSVFAEEMRHDTMEQTSYLMSGLDISEVFARFIRTLFLEEKPDSWH